MNHDPQREAALFEAAAKLNGRERATFLDGACHGDPDLRARLDARLSALDQTESTLVDSSASSGVETFKATSSDLPDESVGQQSGRYKILEKVGEGGWGVVYVAEQTEPVRRRVALKVVKLGKDIHASPAAHVGIGAVDAIYSTLVRTLERRRARSGVRSKHLS
jgi:hypothetical protein